MAGVAVPVGLVLTGGNAIPMNGERTARENLSAIRESFRPPSVPMPIKNQVWKTTPLCSGSAIGESTNEEPDENDTAKEPTMRTRSLSFHISVWLAIATAIGMGAYAIYQYATMPGHTVLDLLLHHSWHVLALGAAVYVVSWVAFHKLIVQPLTKIYLHLYAMGAGQFAPLVLKSNVSEIHTIVEGINLMLRRVEQGMDANALEHAQRDITELKETIGQWEVSEPDAKSLALEKLVALEKSLSAVVRNVHAPGKPTPENSPFPQGAEA